MSASALQLIVGLGNPGPQYQATRHNAGAWFVKTILNQYAVSLKPESRFQGLAGEFALHGQKIRLLIPTTYMNRSGLAVKLLASYYKIPVSSILVAHDELDFAPGVLRLKKAGGHGGHNGLRDLVQQLNSADFWRLRIGIGHPGDRDQVSEYVLSAPNRVDESAIQKAIQSAVDLLPRWVMESDWQQIIQILHSQSIGGV